MPCLGSPRRNSTQPDRVRLQQTQSQTAPGARAETATLGPGDQHRTGARPEYRRGHYVLATDTELALRLWGAFTELARAI